jgi:hypothetical protein
MVWLWNQTVVNPDIGCFLKTSDVFLSLFVRKEDLRVPGGDAKARHWLIPGTLRSSVVWSDQFEVFGARDCFSAVGAIKLAEDGGGVGFDRAG